VIQILAALLERGRTGRGSHIVVSMTHGSHRLVSHRLGGEPVPCLLTGGAACYCIYSTADGRALTVAALEPKFWRRLCELVELPGLESRAFEPRLPELEQVFATRTLDEWLALFDGEDVCVGPVATLAEAAGEFSETQPAQRAPLLGEHTAGWRAELQL